MKLEDLQREKVKLMNEKVKLMEKIDWKKRHNLDTHWEEKDLLKLEEKLVKVEKEILREMQK